MIDVVLWWKSYDTRNDESETKMNNWNASWDGKDVHPRPVYAYTNLEVTSIGGKWGNASWDGHAS